MATYKTVTSANSVLMLAVANLYPTPQKIEGFRTDAMFDPGNLELAQGERGADGYVAYGFVFNLQNLSIDLLANSPSHQFFDDWVAATKTAREIYRCDGTILLPSIGRKVTLVNGTLKSYPPFPAAKKQLDGLRYELMFEDMIPETTA